jgi:hypothetical protein
MGFASPSLYLAFRTTLFLVLLAGCVPTVYKQGTVDNPLNHLKLGQT